ncbi:sodium:proton antiporter [Kangiella sp. TOML190]|uniref:cation:proton antiporter n=1 Tax=Kangiella sp. TOML190 TaxID=2931351 RepID=UPI002041FD6B|nr:sodium:proton antiporter [Kangiella sp. TOML190]
MDLTPMVILAAIVFLGFACQWLAWKIKLPAILLLLTCGILVGPVFELLQPDQLFGDLLNPAISLAVAIILFEGSLTLKFSEVKQVGKAVNKLISIGALITWVLISVGSYYLLQLPLQLSVLFGAILTVTGPTVVIPMLRTIRPNETISKTLRWEGILIDPIGALLAVMVFEFIVLQSHTEVVGPLLWLFLKIIIGGTILGLISGWLLEQLLGREMIPQYLHNMATLAFVLLTCSVSNAMAHESGLLAVTLMGIWLANSKKVHIEEILNFKENLTILLISLLFIVLSAQLQIEQLVSIIWMSLGAYCITQFIARPVAVWVSTINTSLSWKERVLVAWIGPRGIVAAAISALFALKLQAMGFEKAEYLVSLTFAVIIGTVLVQSLTSKFLGNLLGVTEPDPNGYLIFGASPIAVEIAKELKENGARVILSDMSYTNIQNARMAGLKTFYGNPVSEFADQHLNLIGIGKLLALSPQRELNTIACFRYASEFGRENVYHIATTTDKTSIKKHQSKSELRGRNLFGDDVTFSKISSLHKSGYEIRTTPITDEFTFEDYEKKNPDAIKLFYLDEKNRIQIVTQQHHDELEGSYKIVALLPALSDLKNANS